MGYWQHVQTAAAMGGHYPWVLLGTIGCAFALAALVPEARVRLRMAVTLTLVSLCGVLVCGLMLDRGATADYAGYRAVHFLSELFLAVAVINVVGVLLFRVILAAVRLKPATILRDVIYAVVYIAVALTLLRRHDVDLAGIVATSAVVTAVIGFSLQDTLGNIMGGMALQMERSIGVGDWIRVGDVEGLVREIRWRQTSIETRNWDTVIVPNSVLMKSQVIVLGRRDGQPRLHRMWVYFDVDYRHAPAEVIGAVEKALQGETTPNVAPDPRPNCILMDFKESYGHYAVRYWLMDFARDDPTSSEIRCRIFAALRRAGISPSIPAQRVFMTLEGRTRARRKQQEELDRRTAALKGAAIFQSLNEEERAELAGKLTVAPFRRGEVITRQGNVAHYLYVITRGEAEVCVSADRPAGSGPNGDGQSRRVATLRAGDVFGEMGLMTGEPRSATVVALTDVECYRLDKAGFVDALQRRPELVEGISLLLAKRRVERDATLRGLNEEALRRQVSNTQGDLLHRIRKFFTLG